ncbi:hypothetical protein NYE25_03020 [Paenibacillus sp. FSL E2-8871]|uniref:hypothetical protein n=1 Tax=Paenibacillus sp. FSL E2-8871 TaxID=2975326 RepID=UPI0030F925DB
MTITYPESQNDNENGRSSWRYYLQQSAQLAQKNGSVISAQMLGLDSGGTMFILLDTNHNRLRIDNLRGVIVSRSFSWLYGIQKGGRFRYSFFVLCTIEETFTSELKLKAASACR